MANFTLDDIRAAADKQYGSTDITLTDGSLVKLVNALRLPKEKRDKLMNLSDRFDEDDVDQADVFADAIRLAAEVPSQAEKLLAEIDGDLAILASLFGSYTGATDLGEASASES